MNKITDFKKNNNNLSKLNNQCNNIIVDSNVIVFQPDDNNSNIETEEKENKDVRDKKKNIESENDIENDGVIKLNPYNLNNKLITIDNINTILLNQDIDIPVMNIDNYQLAFIHKSYCMNKNKLDIDNSILVDKPEDALPLFYKSNETLEFLGDSILNYVVGDYIYERFPDQNEGFMTKIRTRIVNGQQLGKLSKNIGLSEFMIISRHVEERCNGRENLRILEDVFETFIGSIYLDNIDTDDNEQQLIEKLQNLKKITKSSKIVEEVNQIIKMVKDYVLFSNRGIEICRQFIINIIEKYIDFTDLINNDNNYKDQLLRYFQHHFQDTPKYREISCDGPPHNRQFTMAVLNVNGSDLSIGISKTKKQAEQLASKKALDILTNRN